MSTPIGQRPAGIIEPVAEVEVGALLNVLVVGRLPLPEIPVQFLRDGNRLERAFAQTGGENGGDLRQIAEAAVADEFAGEAELGVAALLAAGLQNASRFAHGFGQAFAFINGEREWFFAVDILAGLDGSEVHQRVPVIRRGVDDHVNVLVLEQLAEVVVNLRSAMLLGNFARMLLIHVANRDDLAEASGVLGVAAAHPARAYLANARLAVGSRR